MNENDINEYIKRYENQFDLGLMQINGFKSTSLSMSVASKYAFRNVREGEYPVIFKIELINDCRNNFTDMFILDKEYYS